MQTTENEDKQREVKKQTERQEEDGDARCHAGSSVLIKWVTAAACYTHLQMVYWGGGGRGEGIWKIKINSILMHFVEVLNKYSIEHCLFDNV